MSEEKEIVWTDDLSIGIQEIDEQHKILVGLLNEMHKAVSHSRGSEVALEILDRLIEYTRIHFAVEESLMRILHYDDYETHKKEHEALVKEVLSLRERLVSGHEKVSFKLLFFLRLWLTEHIQGSDKGYAEDMLKKGVKSKWSDSSRSWLSKIWG